MHASSMVESTADNHLTVDTVTQCLSSALLTPSMLLGPHSLSAADHQTVNGGTQWMLLSDAVNSPMVCGAQRGPGSMLWSAAPRQTLPLRLRRRGSRACPARHGARPAPRLAGPSRPLHIHVRYTHATSL